MGWSQGGYISAFLTTKHSDRFKAISVGAGISDWMTYYVNTDIHPFTRQYLKATPWDDPKIYADTSPMTYIKQARTPTLIQHGDQDARVPIPNAFQLYQGLRDQNVPVQLSIFKGFGHGINKPKANRAAMQQNLDWFTRYIWNQPAGTHSQFRDQGFGLRGLRRQSEADAMTLDSDFVLSRLRSWSSADSAAGARRACDRDSRRHGAHRHARHDPERRRGDPRRQDRRGRRTEHGDSLRRRHRRGEGPLRDARASSTRTRTSPPNRSTRAARR